MGGQRIVTAVPVSGQQPGTVHVQLVPQGTNPATTQQHIIIATQPLTHTTQATEPDDRRMAAFMEYFVEQQPVCSTVSGAGIQYQNPGIVTTK